MAADNAFSARLDAAIKRHNKGVQGDRQAVADAFAQLSELRGADPNNALIEAYYGSSLALMARDETKVTNKADKANLALASLDRAVTMAPGNVVVRLIRANVCMRLPEDFFGRTQTAINDFNELLAQNQKKPGFLTTAQHKEVLQGLAKAYDSTGKASQAKAVRQQLSKLR
jgi:predicted Zn-dependent protease